MEDHERGEAPRVADMFRDPAREDQWSPAARSLGAPQGGSQPKEAGPPAANGVSANKAKKRRKRKRGRKVFARDSQGRILDMRNGADAAPKPAEPNSIGIAGAGGARPQRRSGTPNAADAPAYAALDLGTNNCRLLVAIPTRPGHFRVVDAFSRIVRLGEGLSASGRLGDAAMNRAVDALKVCADKLAGRKLRRMRLIATEACRSAENGHAFLERVKRETGLTLEIIDRRTEARLAVSGCGSLIDRETHGVVLFDIGGGSSEIALIDISRHRTPRLADHIVSWTSLPVGVVSLAERFGGRHVTPEIFEAMVVEVGDLLEAFEGRRGLAHVASGSRFHLLGTSGTVTTLAGVHLELPRYDRRKVDGLWMERDSVDRMIQKLLGWDFEQRKANPCIGADRADLVLAGCAILEAIRRYWPSERLRVADRGLREGMLSEMMAEDGVWRRRRQKGPRLS
ncbi:exopolyphosphatase/guanosine-5'-triphosphate,3'-diphosphate pyrophosphatase [Mesorhizobium sp. J18]|uniref:Ppx/GppA phosphatase family protein n=1 Tax=Mesorhizobium sp. J18 TaxID=935263 RepID=UPI00119C0C21|nr:Ppx/GppA phosphatase family protein [Mesorhizobium sp. J18]TWG89538.1 exopolyphosphatase/guanosine-5'-triphosphate,3'-diphosphate pyrophosphatase [Mesorhizobium sp. J18]